MKSLLTVLFAFSIALFSGCASAPDGGDSFQLAMDAGKHSFGGKAFDVSVVPSSGMIADATFISLSKSSPSGMARGLADQIRQASSDEVNLVVTGPNSSKSKQVLLDALSLAGPRLPKLSVVFLGSAGDMNTVKEALERCGAKLVLTPKP